MSYGKETGVTTAMANRRDVDAAVELYRKIKSDKSGKVVFLAGPPYSGRSDTLLAIGEQLSREEPRPGIIMGGCTGGHYVPCKPSTTWQRSTWRRVNTQRPSRSFSALSPSERRRSARSIPTRSLL